MFTLSMKETGHLLSFDSETSGYYDRVYLVTPTYTKQLFTEFEWTTLPTCELSVKNLGYDMRNIYPDAEPLENPVFFLSGTNCLHGEAGFAAFIQEKDGLPTPISSKIKLTADSYQHNYILGKILEYEYPNGVIINSQNKWIFLNTSTRQIDDIMDYSKYFKVHNPSGYF